MNRAWQHSTIAAAVAAAAAACSAPAPSVATPVAGTPLVSDGQWVRDSLGRVVILRGANYSGLEFGDHIGTARGPSDADFAQMEAWGFDAIRLPIAWSYLEPSPGDLDPSYLEQQVEPVVELAAAHGIWVILEMHQFQWSPCFSNGNGAPAWVCDLGDYGDDTGGQLEASCDFFRGIAAPDGRPLTEHFTDVWRLIAGHFAGDDRIAGFDFFNEPNGLGCFGVNGDFEADALHPFYRQLRDAVIEEGADFTWFYSPHLGRNAGLPAFTEPLGDNVVYAPHLYTQTAGFADRQYDGNADDVRVDYEQALAEAAQLGGVLVATEYGGNTSADGGYLAATELAVRDHVAEQNRRLVGGLVWAVFPGDNTFSVVDADGVEKGELGDLLATPYARAIAGTPTAMSFDRDRRAFELGYTADPGLFGDAPTEIFVPTARHYPDGFDVIASDGDAVEIDGDIVRVIAAASGEREVRIVPR